VAGTEWSATLGDPRGCRLNGKTAWLLVASCLVIVLAGCSERRSSLTSAPASTYVPPAVQAAATAAATAPPVPTTYVVRANDTLYGIATTQRVTLGALMQANGFPTSEVRINPGDVLSLPQPPSRSLVAVPATPTMPSWGVSAPPASSGAAGPGVQL
jgi:LysM repeat protein